MQISQEAFNNIACFLSLSTEGRAILVADPQLILQTNPETFANIIPNFVFHRQACQERDIDFITANNNELLRKIRPELFFKTACGLVKSEAGLKALAANNNQLARQITKEQYNQRITGCDETLAIRLLKHTAEQNLKSRYAKNILADNHWEIMKRVDFSAFFHSFYYLAKTKFGLNVIKVVLDKMLRDAFFKNHNDFAFLVRCLMDSKEGQEIITSDNNKLLREADQEQFNLAASSLVKSEQGRAILWKNNIQLEQRITLPKLRNELRLHANKQMILYMCSASEIKRLGTNTPIRKIPKDLLKMMVKMLPPDVQVENNRKIIQRPYNN